MKKAKDILLAILNSDVFVIALFLAMAYGYIKLSLAIMEHMVR